MARTFSPTGGATSSEIAVNVTVTGFQRHPAISADPSGNYAIAWESVDPDGLVSRLKARRFRGAAALAGEVSVDASSAATAQRNPKVASDFAGSFVVAWDGAAEDGAGTGVVAQEFDDRQVAQGAKVVLNTTTAGDQSQAAIAASAGGQLLVAWQSQTAAGDAASVAARAAAIDKLNFFTLPPCRLLDTRNPNGPLGGPALAAGAARNFVLAGVCGIPATAKALSLNATVVAGSSNGYIALYPGDSLFPPTSTLSFNAAVIKANNTVMGLSRDGAGSLNAYASVGPVHFILDVNGYFQ